MNDYCLYPALCGPGMDCTKCYEQYVPNLQAENERLQVQIKDLHDACEQKQEGLDANKSLAGDLLKVEAENERLRGEVEQLHSGKILAQMEESFKKEQRIAILMTDANADLLEVIKTYKSALKEAVEVIEFYGNESNWKIGGFEAFIYKLPIVGIASDKGQKARDFLAKQKTPD